MEGGRNKEVNRGSWREENRETGGEVETQSGRSNQVCKVYVCVPVCAYALTSYAF